VIASDDLLRLLPPCARADCPYAPGEPPGHKHLLPHQREMLEATEKNVCGVGGFGSGKSVAAAIMGHRLSVSVPGNRGIVIRRTYPKLHDTAMRVFFEVLDRAGVEYEGRERRDSWPHWILYPNGSEIVFRESKDLGRFLGPEYGWAWVDEAQEEPEKTFVDLTGRIRLPAARDYLKLILTTNPPGMRHWITRLFGVNPGVQWKTDMDVISGRPVKTGFRRVGSRSVDNPALPPSYVADLRAVLPAGEVARVLDGKTGYVYSGKPVYGNAFSFSTHVGEWEPEVHPATGLLRPMTRSWDFGFHSPCVLIIQGYQCWKGSHHALLCDTCAPTDLETDDLAKLVLDFCKTKYGNCETWTEIGDTAGAATNERGPGPIVRLAAPKPYGLGLRFRHKKFPTVDPGIQLVIRMFKLPKCLCGKPIVMIHRRNDLFIDAMAGGYHYAPQKDGREENPKPVKDGLYDNPADCWRYYAELGYRPMGLDQAMLERLNAYQPPQSQWKLPAYDESLTRIVPANGKPVLP
jgi:hypothetical protein